MSSGESVAARVSSGERGEWHLIAELEVHTFIEKAGHGPYIVAAAVAPDIAGAYLVLIARLGHWRRQRASERRRHG